MKVSFYLSIVLGIAFLTLRFIGLFLDLAHNSLYLGLGLFFLLGLALPLYLFNRYKYEQKVKKIIKEYQIKETQASKSHKEAESSKANTHDYPSFRDQKQGLKWGGGNIHGASATRGAKRSFLKK